MPECLSECHSISFYSLSAMTDAPRAPAYLPSVDISTCFLSLSERSFAKYSFSLSPPVRTTFSASLCFEQREETFKATEETIPAAISSLFLPSAM